MRRLAASSCFSTIVVPSLLVFAAGCEEHDIGQPCRGLLSCERDEDCPSGFECHEKSCRQSGVVHQACDEVEDCARGFECRGGECRDESRTETAEVVGQSTSFPCEELICIATKGKPGYCSKKCRDDATCPEGFQCRAIIADGVDSDFAGELFCAWKQCTARQDCGEKKKFCCHEMLGSDPLEDLRLCAFSKKGKCE